MTINKTLPVSLSMLLSTVAFAADNSAPVIIDASSCLEIVSPIERLACFEEQANAAQRRPAASMPQQNLPVVSIPRNTRPQPAQSTQPQPTQQVQPQPAAEAPQAAESASVNTANSFEDNFGLREEKEKNSQRNELIARVAEIKELNQNRVLITLDNGQAWEQMETKRFTLAAGDEVRIYPTRWGHSYRLASQSHSGYIQVQRLR